MLEPPQLRTFHSPQIFTTLNKMPATSLKLMSLLHSLVSSHACRVFRALSRAKSLLVDFLREGQLVRCRGSCYPRSYTYYGGSFRFHYNWCSSRSFSIPNSVSLDGLRPNYLQYDAATWNVAEGQEEEEGGGGGSVGLSGYLRWLEERKKPGNDNGEKASIGGGGGSEIDEMADVFIAMCREKFVLEKQESNRRFQEMLARSI
ncbi:hypothetical protein MLD38_033180 [Melastoma candidum]|uniref:Uncharacterized protein n=1 Tax=Melastoma candidum TaxID=119954 RepID=A0ACB9M8J8_9MYRT|nr:hypothetical protein MLD38_033180 [Melastoma candidum]